MKKIIYLLLFYSLLPLFSMAQDIVNAEYFFDTDPGTGAGIPINSITVPADSVTFTATGISVASLEPGFHWLFVRTKTADGLWSLSEPQPFYITFNITAAEYFFDADPGTGNGIAVPVSSPSEEVVLSVPGISVSGLKAGSHWLFVRTRDSNQAWSLSEPQQFYVSQSLVAAEYFLDTDPGVGLGTAIPIGISSDSITFEGSVPTTTFSKDFTHTLFVRTKDETNMWSLYEPQTFYECGTSVAITQGSTINICPEDSVTLNAVVANTTAYELKFNGSNTHVKIPDNSALKPTDFTIESYFKAAAFSGTLIAKNNTASSFDSYAILFPAAGTVAGNINGVQINASGLDTSKWYHVALVKNGTVMSLYLNGAFINSATCIAIPLYSNSSVFIGANDINNDETGDAIFNGKIDEVRIWNYARSQFEIQAAMSTVINPASAGLAGYWRLDDGTGAIAKDRSASHLNGTLINNPAWLVNSSPVEHAFTYSWSPSAGLNNNSTAIVKASPSAITSYTVTVTETGTGCTASSGIEVTVLNPVASSNSPSSGAICELSALYLTCTDANATSFSWTGPAGFSSEEQNPSITKSPVGASGIYTVTVHDALGCTKTTTTDVQITPSYSGFPSDIYVNSDAGACGAVVFWTEPVVNSNCNGYTLIGDHSSGDFFPVGSNTVIYTLTDEQNDTYQLYFSIIVTDNEAPTIILPADITVSSQPGLCVVPEIDVSLGTPTAHDNCGIVSVTHDPHPAYNVGVTNVAWTVTDVHGKTASGVQHVTVTGWNPVASSNSPASAPITEGMLLQLTCNDAAATTFNWTGPDNFMSSLQNPVIPNITPAATGTYKVITSAANGCMSSPATTDVVINSIGAINFSGLPESACINHAPVTLTGSPAGGTFSGDGITGSIFTPALAGVGSHLVTYTIGSASVSKMVLVNPLPIATASSNSPVCAGDSLKLNGSGGDVYSWAGPDNFTSSFQNFFIQNAQAANAGTYSLTVTSASGCQSTTTTDVFVLPGTAYYADADGDGFGNLSGEIQACAAPEGYVSNSSDCDDSNAAIHLGATEVCNSVDDNCDGIIDEKCGVSCNAPMGLIVNQVTEISAKLKWDIVTGAKLYRIRYRLSGNTGWVTTYSLDHSEIINGLSPGSKYEYQVKAYCQLRPVEASEWSYLLEFSTDDVLRSSPLANSIPPEEKINLYPNPTTEKFVVDLQLSGEFLAETGNENSEAMVQVFNVIGNLAYETKVVIQHGALKKEIQLDGAPGIYFVKVTVNKNVITRRVIKQ